MELTLGMYHSFGNDYLIYDCLKNEYELKPEDIRNICNRQFGAGSDGILVGPVQMFGKMGVRIFNPDGSEAAISGNGLFIFAKYLKDAGYINKKEFVLQTQSRTVSVRYHDEIGQEMAISMGKLYCGQTAPSSDEEKTELVPVSSAEKRTRVPVCGWEIFTVLFRWRRFQKRRSARSGKSLHSWSVFRTGSIRRSCASRIRTIFIQRFMSGGRLHTGIRQQLLCGGRRGISAWTDGAVRVCTYAGRNLKCSY